MSIPDFRAYWNAWRDKDELDALMTEDGEQCIYCLRFTYQPGYGCLSCTRGLPSDETERYEEE